MRVKIGLKIVRGSRQIPSHSFLKPKMFSKRSCETKLQITIEMLEAGNVLTLYKMVQAGELEIDAEHFI